MPRKRSPESEPVSSAAGAAAAPAPVRKPRSSRARTSKPQASANPAAESSLGDDNGSIQQLAAAVRPEPAVDPVEVARLAYAYWEARGCPAGSAEEDWLRAERELRSQLSPAGQA